MISSFKIFNPLILVPKFLIPQNWDTSPWKLPAYYPMGINKIVVMMWINVIVLIIFFTIGYNKKKKVQSGFGNLLEILIVFVRDEVVYENLGKEHGKKYLPLILTFFFFILAMNFLGLIPGIATPTANINVTAGLALITLLTYILNGNKSDLLIFNLLNSFFKSIIFKFKILAIFITSKYILLS